MKLHVAAAAFAAALLVPCAARAHQPFFARGDERRAETAFVLGDAITSRVVYVDAPCPAEPFWARIDASPEEVVYITVGVPVLDELRDYRPTVYLAGPDIEQGAVSVPWALPEGYRAIAMPTDDLPPPRVFHEPFTRTDSWILLEHRHVARSAASYLVIIDPPREHGRFWLSSGTVEVPGGEPDALRRIRPFFRAASAPDLGRSCPGDAIVPMGSGAACAIDRGDPPWSAPIAALVIALAGAARWSARRRRARPA